ncbi:hypothetical protein J1C56_28525 [Aminobacter anthyllidis]|uniref:Uncharacterized protein n=1 Tax=Aminobacter anthyllidis TaxID=1035067 RepID=A0A9X1AGP7_9HYPH|nr:hypothetical protein [Aminobacter anthyllidis]MBT1159507.1 hypothetical protein [Aminobacter anthyllidis]
MSNMTVIPSGRTERSGELPLTSTFLRYSGDAFLETLQAELRNTKFIPGVETSMASLRCGRHEVALQFRNARTHLPGIVLTQPLPASYATETLICGKPKHSKFNFR